MGGGPSAVGENLSPETGRDALDTGLARSRGGFMSRLRGLLGGSGSLESDWEAAEEALIAGDIGAGLAMRIVDGAR